MILQYRTTLNRLKKHGVDLAVSIFNADRGYDGKRNFESLYDMCMLPNIKQRKRRRRTAKGKNRKKAAKIFNASVYL